MSPEQEPVVSVRGLTRQYGKGDAAFLALRGVDLDVQKGEVLFISGPSGSGKTTLLSIMGCVLSPTGGVARVLGRDVTRLSERALDDLRLHSIGFIFQGHNLIASQTAVGNVRLPLMLRGIGGRAARRQAVEELVAVGLGDKLNRVPRDLSGGQRQRVAVARATVGDPPLILADEPTASLDAAAGIDVMDILTGLARTRGSTVIVVTHDSRIDHYADRIVHIEDGSLVQEAS
jgi:putative ABC transport system ATP-binding protein